jgi:hypothetical protein
MLIATRGEDGSRASSDEFSHCIYVILFLQHPDRVAIKTRSSDRSLVTTHFPSTPASGVFKKQFFVNVLPYDARVGQDLRLSNVFSG